MFKFVTSLEKLSVQRKNLFMYLVGSILKGAISGYLLSSLWASSPGRSGGGALWRWGVLAVGHSGGGALWRWGAGKRSSSGSLLAGYLQSSLCTFAPSQTKGAIVPELFALFLKSASIGPLLF